MHKNISKQRKYINCTKMPSGFHPKLKLTSDIVQIVLTFCIIQTISSGDYKHVDFLHTT